MCQCSCQLASKSVKGLSRETNVVDSRQWEKCAGVETSLALQEQYRLSWTNRAAQGKVIELP